MTLKWNECVVSKNTVDSIEVAAWKPTTAVRPSAPTAPSATMTLTPGEDGGEQRDDAGEADLERGHHTCSMARSSSAAIGIMVSATASSRNWMASSAMPKNTTNFIGQSGNTTSPHSCSPNE